MSALQELSDRQTDEIIAAAVDRRVPMTVTVQRGRHWQMTAAKALALRDVHLLLELPTDPDAEPLEFIPAEKIGVSFKLKHHKHIFSATVVGIEHSDAGAVLVVCRPNRLQRLQRRAYIRADVPPNRIVRASFWLGGITAEPTGTSPTTPVWSGRVLNISAGGFQLHTDAAAASDVEIGDVIGARIVFGMAEKTVYADAEVRHIELSSARATIGCRFVGLDQTAEGQAAMQLIAAKVSEYQRLGEAQRQAAAAQGHTPVLAAHGASEDA